MNTYTMLPEHYSRICAMMELAGKTPYLEMGAPVIKSSRRVYGMRYDQVNHVIVVGRVRSKSVYHTLFAKFTVDALNPQRDRRYQSLPVGKERSLAYLRNEDERLSRVIGMANWGIEKALIDKKNASIERHYNRAVKSDKILITLCIWLIAIASFLPERYANKIYGNIA